MFVDTFYKNYLNNIFWNVDVIFVNNKTALTYDCTVKSYISTCNIVLLIMLLIRNYKSSKVKHWNVTLIQKVLLPFLIRKKAFLKFAKF